MSKSRRGDVITIERLTRQLHHQKLMSNAQKALKYFDNIKCDSKRVSKRQPKQPQHCYNDSMNDPQEGIATIYDEGRVYNLKVILHSNRNANKN